MSGNGQTVACSPGSHPHTDRPNWQPAETLGEYLRNCREGLEEYSDRRVAKLLGFSRAHVWRMKWAAELPEDLFERLMAMRDHAPSLKEMANVARALYGGENHHDVERCPHCGETLRVRGRWRKSTAQVVDGWLSEQRTLGGEDA